MTKSDPIDKVVAALQLAYDMSPAAMNELLNHWAAGNNKLYMEHPTLQVGNPPGNQVTVLALLNCVVETLTGGRVAALYEDFNGDPQHHPRLLGFKKYEPNV
jgi:hypothetical protein